MKNNSTPVVAIAIAVVTCFAIAGAVVIAVAIPEGGNPGSLIALLLGSLAPTIATLAALMKVNAVAEHVEYLANGGGDAKNRAALADVLKPELLKDDDETAALLASDRVHRSRE